MKKQGELAVLELVCNHVAAGKVGQERAWCDRCQTWVTVRRVL